MIEEFCNKAYLREIRLNCLTFRGYYVNELKHKGLATLWSLWIYLIENLIKSSHKLYFSEQFDELILCKLAIFHNFESDKPPRFLAFCLADTTVATFTNVALDFVFLLNSPF